MKKKILRIVLYVIGLMILAFGITLNVRTGLGTSPIISVSNVFAIIFSFRIGDTTFILYSIFVLSEIVIHIIQRNNEKNLTLTAMVLKDILQLPLALLFTRIMNIFELFIPNMRVLEEGFLSTPLWQMTALLIAIAATGIGATFSLDMRIVPNPGDGIVQAISDISGKDIGLIKNIFDGSNVLLAALLGLIFQKGIVGIGIGTLLAFLGVGRVIYIFNRFFGKRLSLLLS